LLVTNDKTLLTRAGLRHADHFIAIAVPDAKAMLDVVE
jgi:hypothetical protein